MVKSPIYTATCPFGNSLYHRRRRHKERPQAQCRHSARRDDAHNGIKTAVAQARVPTWRRAAQRVAQRGHNRKAKRSLQAIPISRETYTRHHPILHLCLRGWDGVGRIVRLATFFMLGMMPCVPDLATDLGIADDLRSCVSSVLFTFAAVMVGGWAGVLTALHPCPILQITWSGWKCRPRR